MNKQGEFGTIYTRFKGKPKEAIRHLIKTKEGECTNALFRKEIGYVDIIWGQAETAEKKGFGLAHIISEHGEEIKQLGFDIESFIVVAFNFGKITAGTKSYKIFLEGDKFRLVIQTQWNKKDKKFLLTSYDLRPIYKKNPKRAIKLKRKSTN